MTKPSADLILAHAPGFYDFRNRSLRRALDLERVFEDVEVLGLDLRWMIAELGDEILWRNAVLYTDKVVNQSFPVPRSIGRRWYDEVPRSAEWISQRTREEPRMERAIA